MTLERMQAKLKAGVDSRGHPLTAWRKNWLIWEIRAKAAAVEELRKMLGDPPLELLWVRHGVRNPNQPRERRQYEFRYEGIDSRLLTQRICQALSYHVTDKGWLGFGGLTISDEEIVQVICDRLSLALRGDPEKVDAAPDIERS